MIRIAEFLIKFVLKRTDFLDFLEIQRGGEKFFHDSVFLELKIFVLKIFKNNFIFAILDQIIRGESECSRIYRKLLKILLIIFDIKMKFKNFFRFPE